MTGDGGGGKSADSSSGRTPRLGRGDAGSSPASASLRERVERKMVAHLHSVRQGRGVIDIEAAVEVAVRLVEEERKATFGEHTLACEWQGRAEIAEFQRDELLKRGHDCNTAEKDRRQIFKAWMDERLLKLAAEKERDEFVQAERTLHKAYMEVRTALGAFNTKPGGVDRFEVTLAAIQKLKDERDEARSLYEHARMPDGTNVILETPPWRRR